jgi:hypothetical protein
VEVVDDSVPVLADQFARVGRLQWQPEENLLEDVEKSLRKPDNNLVFTTIFFIHYFTGLQNTVFCKI